MRIYYSIHIHCISVQCIYMLVAFLPFSCLFGFCFRFVYSFYVNGIHRTHAVYLITFCFVRISFRWVFDSFSITLAWHAILQECQQKPKIVCQMSIMCWIAVVYILYQPLRKHYILRLFLYVCVENDALNFIMSIAWWNGNGLEYIYIIAFINRGSDSAVLPFQTWNLFICLRHYMYL